MAMAAVRCQSHHSVLQQQAILSQRITCGGNDDQAVGRQGSETVELVTAMRTVQRTRRAGCGIPDGGNSSHQARMIPQCCSLVLHLDELKSVVILRLPNMTAIDATGLKAIEDFADAVHASGRAAAVRGAVTAGANDGVRRISSPRRRRKHPAER